MNKVYYYYVSSIFVLLCVICIESKIYGQELRGVPCGIFQRVQIEHNGIVRQFERSMKDKDGWKEWEEWPAMDMRQVAYRFVPQAVHQNEVDKVLGPISKWLDERGCEVRVSGYYNFTNNSIYDWQKFAGDNYGTYTKTGLFLDFSKFMLPILKK